MNKRKVFLGGDWKAKSFLGGEMSSMFFVSESVRQNILSNLENPRDPFGQSQQVWSFYLPAREIIQIAVPRVSREISPSLDLVAKESATLVDLKEDFKIYNL